MICINANVIEHGKECRDEDDCRQDLEREDGSEGSIRRAQCTKQHLGAGRRCAEHVIHNIAGPSHCALPKIKPQYQEGKDELQAQPP